MVSTCPRGSQQAMKNLRQADPAPTFDRDAWHANHSLSRTEAKRRYISTLIDTMHKYATTTPEARELVSELEFVWDQIKSNPPSSTESSPGHVSRIQNQQFLKANYASIGLRSSGQENNGDLRVLRPVSDADEEDDSHDEIEREAQKDTYDEEGVPVTGLSSAGQDPNVYNRKWRKRMERALVTLSTEIAALREQIEARRIREGEKRNGIWAWMMWLVCVTIRHTLINLTLLGLLAIWARRKRHKNTMLDPRVQYAVDQLRKILWPLMAPKQH